MGRPHPYHTPNGLGSLLHGLFKVCDIPYPRQWWPRLRSIWPNLTFPYVFTNLCDPRKPPKINFYIQEAPCELSGASWNLLRLPASSLGPSGATAGQAHISWMCNQIILEWPFWGSYYRMTILGLQPDRPTFHRFANKFLLKDNHFGTPAG